MARPNSEQKAYGVIKLATDNFEAPLVLNFTDREEYEKACTCFRWGKYEVVDAFWGYGVQTFESAMELAEMYGVKKV